MNSRTTRIQNLYLPLTLVLGISAVVPAQRAEQSKPSPTPPDEEVLRIPVSLVQVDVVVRDKNGRPVADLRPEDFEIFEDGKAQQITNFSYIRSAGGASEKRPAMAKTESSETPQAPLTTSRVDPNDVRRTIIFVIDNMSYDSFMSARKAIRKFVDTQMQTGDLVAVLRMGEGMSAFQQFTTDKALMSRIVDALRWEPSELYGVNAVPDQGNTAEPPNDADNEGPIGGVEEKNAYEQRRLRGKLAQLSLIVRGIEPLAGRKTMFLFSDYMVLFGSVWDGFDNNRTKEELRIVTGQANRALVTINTIDARELQPLGMTAADQMEQMPAIGQGRIMTGSGHPNPNAAGQLMMSRSRAFVAAQEGLHELAERTGGKFTQGNDAATDIASGLKDEGYYLIAYTLDDKGLISSEARRNFHKLEVRVKRPEVNLRSRKEFYGVPPVDIALRNNQPAQKMLAALTSPYRQTDVGFKLTSLFGHDKQDGSFVRSLLHVDARDLTFSAEPDGHQQAFIRVLVLAFDQLGLVGVPVAQTYTIRTTPAGLEKIRRDGVVYEMLVPIKGYGIYQIRAAVQDLATEKIGASDQLIEVPPVGTNRVALSSVLLSAKAGKNGLVEPQASAAVRQFRAGMQLGYSFILYKPKIKAGSSPSLDGRISIYRDGNSIYTTPLDLSGGDQNQVVVKGAMQLGNSFAPGSYVLQVLVTERFDKKRVVYAARSMEFEVVG